MGSYYENALCTIAANTAADSQDGCLLERPASRFPSAPCYLPPWTTAAGVSETICINPSIPLWWYCVVDSPLYQRGWTVQERALSRRTLYFTKDALYFECAGLQASEYRPSGLHWQEIRAIHENLAKEVHLGLGRMMKYSRSEILGWAWYRLLERYCWLGFKYPTDKLVALSGMAKRIQHYWPDTYCAGLWREKLVEGLAWHTRYYDRNGPKALSDYAAPSWSWASVNAVVCFPHVGIKIWSWHAEVVDVTMTPTTAEDDCGQLSGGRLRIQGVIQDLWLAVQPKTDDPTCLWFESAETSDCTTEKTTLFLDTPPPPIVRPPFMRPCLFLGSDKIIHPHASQGCLLFIVLEPTGQSNDEYRRIGLVEKMICPEMMANKTVWRILSVGNSEIDVI